ncbi:Thiol:disulfide interchange protein DsbD precursor [Polystyrenella longa]|uniref:Thiol:disulfide interchange protein DsbD n=1 Tax=Polystyrenella longa TaxID=2528007 RepID=A0A518CPK4_9PLAN|nr:thioredoxin family protein [Polystyrenella longa]QDU81155.1 Thiol:disulfide interchange protein DsbD precursor [Polystyrenella longa]
MPRQFYISLCCTILFLIAASVTVPVSAQNGDLNSLFQNDASEVTEPSISINLSPEQPKVGDEVTLSIKVELPAGMFTYAQDNKSAAKPSFKITENTGLKEIDTEFKPDQKAKSDYDDVLELTSLKYYEQITWSRRYEVTASTGKLAGKVLIPICDDRSCQMYRDSIDFTISAPGAAEEQSGGSSFGELVSEEDSSGSISFGTEVDNSGAFGEEISGDSRSAIVTIETFPLFWSQEVKVDDQEVATLRAILHPGDEETTPRVEFTAELAEGWHTYSTDEQKNAQHTTFDFKKLQGLQSKTDNWQSDQPPVTFPVKEGKEKFDQYIYPKMVTWTHELALEPDAKQSGVELTAQIQFCSEEVCLTPSSYTFRLGSVPVEQDLESTTSIAALPPEIEEWFKGIRPLEEESIQATGFGWYLFYAFLGGVILNVMPCVLPVLAIKILSFVKQAGEDRSRIIALNVAYSLGVISIFMVLATLIGVASFGWGGLFQSTAFNLLMTCFIFAMALSLLGVYEIPIPGMVGSAGGQQKEGLTGAFLTGIFATILATPCSGPFLGATLAWSATQPIHITYLIFLMMGLGMASPYLILGAFPKAVQFLPKPGNWMVHVKEVSGFILLATVIFFLSYIDDNFQIPLLAMLLAIGFALWMIGRAPATLVSRATYFVNRVTAFGVAGLVCFYAYQSATMLHESELPWRPFSTQALKEASDEGKTVLIDFTADWCVNCKVVEQTALNTPKTFSFVETHDVVTLVADWTDGDEEITRWLNKFESKSIPLTVIFPANRPNNPILIRDLYFQDTLLKKLDQAVSLPPSQTAATPASESR